MARVGAVAGLALLLVSVGARPALAHGTPACTGGVDVGGVVTGTPGPDFINCRGNPLPHLILAMGGNDIVAGGFAGDVIVLDAGDDHADGFEGDDVILGGPGNDFLVGNAGADLLFGDAGFDTMFGEDGFDVLIGPANDGSVDVLDGGPDSITDLCFGPGPDFDALSNC